MEIRRYKSVYLEQMARLFYETVHSVNKKDYSDLQLDVWASGDIDFEVWDISFRKHLSYVAVENDMVIGFGDIDDTGYLDRLYVHKDFQGRGVATAICDRLEMETPAEAVVVHASVTAKPFFEKRGYETVRGQEVLRGGIALKNYVMKKALIMKTRSETETAVYRLLERENIDFLRIDHEAAATMEICAEIEKNLGAPICKNLFLCNRQQTDFYLLMIPSAKAFKTKYLSSQLGCARLSFAGEEQMSEYLGIRPGAVSPMGLMNDRDGKVRLIIDRDLLSLDTFGCHPCVNTSTVSMKFSDLLEKFLPAVCHGYTVVTLPDE